MKFPLSLVGVLLLAAPGFAQEAPSTAKNVVHLLGLTQAGKLSKADLNAIAEEANAIYLRLGVNMTVVVYPGPVTAFDVAKINKAASFAVIGPLNNVKVFAAKKDAKNSGYLSSWEGGMENPEYSQNDFYYGGDVMGGRIVAVDANGFEAYGKRYGWTRAQSGALLIVHGTGHNADSDNRLQHNDAGIMLDGNIREQLTSRADSAYAVTTSKAKNPRLIAALLARYTK